MTILVAVATPALVKPCLRDVHSAVTLRTDKTLQGSRHLVYLTAMVTIHREGGLRISIFKDDHHPAHVHVMGDGEAKVNLVGPDGGPSLVWNAGLSNGDVRRALRIIAEQQSVFLARWSSIHG